MINNDVILFFDKYPGALPLYEAFAKQVKAELGDVNIKVQKTQITFYNKHNFAFVSFLPVRPAKLRPKNYIVVTFGLSYHVDSPRIDAASEPYPNRWTHHVLISSEKEIDDELMDWIKKSADLSAKKR